MNLKTNTFSLILILILNVNCCLFQSDCYQDYNQDYQFGRPSPRVLSWKRGNKGIAVTTKQENGITVANCGKVGAGIKRRIVGGSDAVVGQFPWTVLIETNGQPFCVGAILNERWIITAAHCFRYKKSRQKLTIRVGTVESNGGTVYSIVKLVIHEKYNKDGMQNSDLALLKTGSVIQGLRNGRIILVNGICLPKNGEEPKGSSLLVLGWGRTGEEEEPSRLLKFVKLDIIDERECAQAFKIAFDDFPYGYNIYRSQICAYAKNKDACQGDSGGPAIEYQDNRAVLIGVVSFGIGCASEFPGVYTKISYFIDWIVKSID